MLEFTVEKYSWLVHSCLPSSSPIVHIYIFLVHELAQGLKKYRDGKKIPTQKCLLGSSWKLALGSSAYKRYVSLVYLFGIFLVIIQTCIKITLLCMWLFSVEIIIGNIFACAVISTVKGLKCVNSLISHNPVIYMLSFLPFHIWRNGGTEKLRVSLVHKENCWQKQNFNSGYLVPETALNLCAASGVFTSLLLGTCTVLISFSIRVFSVCIFLFLSLCCSRRSLGFGGTRSHLIFTEVNIIIYFADRESWGSEVSCCLFWCDSEHVMSLCLRFLCLLNEGNNTFQIVVRSKWTFMRMVHFRNITIVLFISSPFLYCTELS